MTDVALVNTLDASLVVSSSRSYFHPLGKPTSDPPPAVTTVYSDVAAARGQQESVGGGSSSSSVMRGDIGIVICDVNSSGAADNKGRSDMLSVVKDSCYCCGACWFWYLTVDGCN